MSKHYTFFFFFWWGQGKTALNILNKHVLDEKYTPDFVSKSRECKDKLELVPLFGNCNLLEVGVRGNTFRKRFPLNYRKCKSQIEWKIEGPTGNRFRK